MNFAAFACVSRPSTTRRMMARRSSSLLLILISSWATAPPFRRRHVAESGHFYLARSGHFHLAATEQGPIRKIPSTTSGTPHPERKLPEQRCGGNRCRTATRGLVLRPRPVLQAKTRDPAELALVVRDEDQLPADGLCSDQRVERTDGRAS